MAHLVRANGLELFGVQAFTDNYIWLGHVLESGFRFVVDPGDAEPVLGFLKDRGWSLDLILCTHHHPDHIDGVAELATRFRAPVWCGRPDQNRIPLATRPLDDGETVVIGGLEAQILKTPGHTAGHVIYHFVEQDILFVGDLLFGAGCGRIFEGTYSELFASIQRIAKMPQASQIFCANEYTLANLKFALSLEPQNPSLITRLANCQKLRAQLLPTVPLSLAEELETNPFLRTNSPELRLALNNNEADEIEIFRELRERRNRF